MKNYIVKEQKCNEKKYLAYKRLIRNLRRGKVEKANSEKIDNNISNK